MEDMSKPLGMTPEGWAACKAELRETWGQLLEVVRDGAGGDEYFGQRKAETMALMDLMIEECERVKREIAAIPNPTEEEGHE